MNKHKEVLKSIVWHDLAEKRAIDYALQVIERAGVEEIAQVIYEDATYLDMPISRKVVPTRTIERCRRLASAISNYVIEGRKN